MKQSESAQIIFKMIKTYRRITATNIEKKTNISRRRIYDVTIVLSALGLIDFENDGRTKIYIWKGTHTNGKSVTFNAHAIKIETNGVIMSMNNKGTYAIIKATDKLRVENYIESLE